MDSSRKNKFRRRKRQELNEKRRLRRAKKALDAEAKGLRKRRLNMRTRELLHKANGKPLAKEVLEECMLSMLALSEHRVSMTTATCAATKKKAECFAAAHINSEQAAGRSPTLRGLEAAAKNAGMRGGREYLRAAFRGSCRVEVKRGRPPKANPKIAEK